MSKLLKIVFATVIGFGASSASSKAAVEEKLYHATKDQNTLEAADVFLKAYPDSRFSQEIRDWADQAIRRDHHSKTFEEENVEVARKGREKKRRIRRYIRKKIRKFKRRKGGGGY